MPAGIVTSLLVSLLGQARIYVILGRDRLLPGWLAVVDEKHQTPINATVFTGATSGKYYDNVKKVMRRVNNMENYDLGDRVFEILIVIKEIVMAKGVQYDSGVGKLL